MLLFSDVDIILDDLCFLSAGFESSLWTHPRDRNTASYNLARVLPQVLEQVWLGLCLTPTLLLGASHFHPCHPLAAAGHHLPLSLALFWRVGRR